MALRQDAATTCTAHFTKDVTPAQKAAFDAEMKTLRASANSGKLKLDKTQTFLRLATDVDADEKIDHAEADKLIAAVRDVNRSVNMDESLSAVADWQCASCRDACRSSPNPRNLLITSNRPNMNFKLISPFSRKAISPRPSGSSRRASGRHAHQVLLGVTGSGKTFTVAKVIETINRPTLVLSHNKTLAAQLYQEFKNFFPENTVEYFVSYYDYYQPEAYIPQNDLYIEKEMTKNDEIDKLRLAATKALFERRDVIIVSSVSCIYGIGDPDLYYRHARSSSSAASRSR